MTAPINVASIRDFEPGRLWSLAEMLKVTAQEYIKLGREIADAEISFAFDEGEDADTPEAKESRKEHGARIKRHMISLKAACEKLGLSTSIKLIAQRIDDLPQTDREFKVIVDAIWAELDGKLFFFVPSERSEYYENSGLSDVPESVFPRVTAELEMAGNCYVFDMPTAAVFHAMRAAEIGIRMLGSALGVNFSAPIELMEWQQILNAITPKIRDIENQPKSTQRDNDLEFFGVAAAQLRYFKDGWRIHVAHAGAFYSTSQAKEAIDHVRALFEILALRLREGS